MKRFFLVLLALLMAFGALPARAEDFAQRLFEGSGNETLYEMFSDAVKAQVSYADFEALVPQLTGAFGALESIGEPSQAPYGGQTVTTQVITLEKQVLLLQLVQDENGLITGIGFTPYQAPAEPQTADAPLPEGIVERDITVGEGEFALPGVLTLPENGENLRAVVLVQGSGPSDRDETIGPNKPFRDIAHALAQSGIASIRYDKRTYVHGVKMGADITIEEETIKDAILVAKLLLKTPEIDGANIFLLGHSLGAMQAPRIALEADGLFKGMLLMAGSPNTLLDIMIAQNRAVIAQLEPDMQSAQTDALEAEISRVEGIFKLPVEEIKKETAFTVPAYYFYEMQLVDAVETIKALQIPTFIFQGDGDFQVTPENGIEAYKAALNDAQYVQYALYPGLNHLMMASVQTQSTRDYEAPLTVDAQVLKDIAAFVSAH